MTTRPKRADSSKQAPAKPTERPKHSASPGLVASVTPLRLHFQSVQKVVVTAEDGKRFETTAKEAAQACRSALDEQAWIKQFEGFLGHLHQWAESHSDVISAAFVGISSEGLTGVLITKGPEYRIDLDDEVTKLDIELAQKYPDCRADVLQSPEEEPESRIPYITQERALQVYGD